MISNNTLSRLQEASAPFVSAGLIPAEEFKQLLTIAKKSQEECKPEPLCLITRDQAAKILGISDRGLDRLIRQSTIPCVRVGKRSVRIDRRKIENYVEENTRCNFIPAGGEVK